MTAACSFAEDDFVSVPFGKLVPRDGQLTCITNRWWMVHPQKGLAFLNPRDRRGRRANNYGNHYGSPQCNTDKRISEWFKKSWAEIQFVDAVFLPSNDPGIR